MLYFSDVMRGVRMDLVLGCASALLLTVAVSPAAAYPVASGGQRLSKRELRQIVAPIRSHTRTTRRRGYLIRPSAHTSIVGGFDADQSSWGFTAFVVHYASPGDADFFCSGTLIAPTVVLTAGHCATDESTGQPLAPGGYKVMTGSVDLSGAADSQVSKVSKVVVNPDYDPSDYFGDAALLVLSSPSPAQTIRLATPDETALYTSGTVAMIAGWGISDQQGDTPATLQAAPTTVQGYDYCSEHNSWYDDTWHAWGSSETCAVDAATRATGTCNGDSGGPLLTSDSAGQPVEIGVTSVGPTDCDTYWPDYFTRTDQLSPWVDNVVRLVSSQSETSSTTSSSTETSTTSTTTTTTSSATNSSTTGSNTTTSTTSTSTKTSAASTPARVPKTTVPPQPTLPILPTLTMADARSYAATMVHARTHTRPHLALTCSRTSNWTVHCAIGWRSGSYSYAVSGRFFHYLNRSRAYWWYSFTGTRSWRTCRVRHARRICTAYVQRLLWS